MSEEPLVERPDSDRVIDALVANHRTFLAFLQRRIGDRALAEDILQEAFSRGLEKVAAIRQSESAVAWFYRVLRNAIVDHARRAGAKNHALAKLATELDSEAAPAEDVHAAVCGCVGSLAENLKPEYAAALRRIDVDGVAVKDFAAEAGLSSSNAAVRVFRAREALRKQVVRSCGTCAEHGCLDCHCRK